MAGSTFVKRIVVGTPIRRVQETLNIGDFRNFDITNRQDKHILVYDSASTNFVPRDSASLQIIKVTDRITSDSGANLVLDPGGDNAITGKVVIRGDLQVDGTETIVNSTTLSINDKNIILADSAADSAAADGAGFTIEGANATFTYDATKNQFFSNKGIQAHDSSQFNKIRSNNIINKEKITSDNLTAVSLAVTDSATIGKTSLGRTNISSTGGMSTFSNNVTNKAYLRIVDSGDGDQLGLAPNEIIAATSGGGTNNLNFVAGSIFFAPGNSFTDKFAAFRTIGGTDLYFGAGGNSSRRLSTTNAGVTIHGTVTDEGATHEGDVKFDSAGGIMFDLSDKALEVNSNLYTINLVDNAQINFGDSKDLQIEHTGSVSTIRNYTGNLGIINEAAGGDIDILADNNDGGFSNYFKADVSEGSVKLYYNGHGVHAAGERLRTTDSGVVITGQLIFDSATVTNVTADSAIITDISGSTLDYDSAVITDLSGTSANFTSINATTATVDSAVITDISGTSANFTTIHGSNATFDSATFNGDVTFDSAGAIMFDKSDKSLKFADEFVAKFGSANDFTISHNELGVSNTRLTNNTGNVIFSNNADNAGILLRTDNGLGGVATYVYADGSTGQVKLYHYGSLRFNTDSMGATITGSLRADSATLTNINLPDNGKILLGDSQDLKIHHDGSHSIIQDAGTGSLLIQSNNFTVQNATGTENQITALSGGAVTLYHNDSARLATTDSGINITGDLLLSNSDSSAIADPTLTFYRNSATPAFNDEMGEIIFQGRNDNSEDVHYGRIVGKIAQAANGAEKGNIEFKIMENGTEATFVQMAFDNVFINKQLTMFNNIFLDGDYSIKWDGATNNANTTSLVVTDPTAVNTITLPDASGTVLLTDSNLTNDITFSGDVAFDSAGAILFDKSDQRLEFGDNRKAAFGDNQDLQIYHEPQFNNSIIQETGSGNLLLGGDQIDFRNSSLTTVRANFSTAVKLNYNGSTRFETTDSGVAITGQLTADSATISGGVTADTFGDGSIYTTNSVTTNILGTANVVVNTFQSSVTTTRKYLAQVKNGTKIQSQEMMLISTDSNAFLTSYAIINSDSDLGTFTADYNSGFARLRFTPTISGTNALKLVFTDISV